MLPPEDAFTES